MFYDAHSRSRLAESQTRERIATAERERLVRLARTPYAWRIATLRLVARGLRVGCDVRIEHDLPLEVARLHGGR
jgi:hypothetical protein